MGKGVSFILLQASVVFNQQMSMFDEIYKDTKEGRNFAFREVINKLIEKKVSKYNKSAEYILVYKATISQDIVYFQLAKKTSIATYTLNNESIEQGSMETYPPLNVFVNLKYQQFAVELNTKILSESAIIKVIKNLTNNRSKSYSVFYNTIEDRKEFWNSMSDKDSIQEISFDLVVPNFFGATGAANELVSGAKAELNADSVELTVKNNKGGLQAAFSAIDSFVKYSSKSGSWKMRIKTEGESRYKTIKSTDYCKKKEIEYNILELIKNIDENAQIGSDLFREFVDHLNGLFEYEE